ncbi:MAG: YceI family protein [Acidobacteria bacterium]|nr:YceI family protein [Acidobacteriota bacterium]
MQSGFFKKGVGQVSNLPYTLARWRLCVGFMLACFTTASTVQKNAPRSFTIDATNSQITIGLTQEGAIRRLHPSHTISVPTYTSKLTLPKDETKTAFELTVEAKSLINIDKTMGDFERKGFQNVLQTQVLESDKFPQIVFKSAGLSALKKDGEKRTFTLTGTLAFRGVTRQVSFPVTATFGKDAITATGSAKINQTDFGITPYADALGAIKVGDEMTINFSIVAKPL